MPDSLLKKVAIVTGADTVAGRAVLSRFLEEGAKVAALSEHADSFDELRNEFPARLTVLTGDIGNEETRVRLIDETRRRMGNVDVLVPIADQPRFGALSDCDSEFLQQQISANCHAPQLLLRRCQRYLTVESSVIFFVPDSKNDPPLGYSAYISAKAALRSLNRTLSVELAPHGIRTNCLIAIGLELRAVNERTGSETGPAESTPGHSSTVGRDLINDIADAAVFLASSASRGITGQEIIVGKRIAAD